jgi:hypothetical protein
LLATNLVPRLVSVAAGELGAGGGHRARTTGTTAMCDDVTERRDGVVEQGEQGGLSARRTRIPYVLLVDSDEGWWDGRGGWVQTWVEAATFQDGSACLAAVEEAQRRTGLPCWASFVQRPAEPLLISSSRSPTASAA